SWLMSFETKDDSRRVSRERWVCGGYREGGQLRINSPFPIWFQHKPSHGRLPEQKSRSGPSVSGRVTVMGSATPRGRAEDSMDTPPQGPSRFRRFVMTTPLRNLVEHGQSPWYDNFRRSFLTSGRLQALIESGIQGVTVNPTIFEKAILDSTDYDATIADLLAGGARPAAIYERLLIEDVTAAADRFRPLYDRTGGGDGFVSIEVSPRLAHNTAASIAEARRFWRAINRPNVMVKIPATAEGMPAIRHLIGEGININITLIFAIASYDQVMEAYLGGLEQRVAAG